MLNKGQMFSSLSNAWFPVALSRQLKPGQHRPVRLFDTRWLLFRTRSGRAAMTSRYCCHLGTDLANGCVVNECIECPMHGWRFGADGDCQHVPVAATIPDSARLVSLQIEERFGIIFAFYGERLLFDFPRLEELSADPEFSAPIIVPLQAPYHVASLNTFDTQHYERVHARRFIGTPELSRRGPYGLRIDYTAEIIQRRWVDKIMAGLSGATTSVSIETWGGGVLLLINRDTGFGSLVGVCPSSEDRCELYIVALKKRRARQGRVRSMGNFLALNLAARLLKTYLAPDWHIVANMRPHRGPLLDGVDDALVSYFEYWQDFPKTPIFAARARRELV